MFTGIVSDIGEVVSREGGRLSIRSSYHPGSIALGASIACDGVCLTATSIKADGPGAVFTVDVSNETMSKTTLGAWQPGTRINLERSLKAGDELGGHLVSGHVDGVARILAVTADGDSQRFTLEAPEIVVPFIATKGSIALDGMSLTINDIDGTRFGVNLIPHTLTVTTWGARRAGHSVNIEIDVLARYVARMLEYRR